MGNSLNSRSYEELRVTACLRFDDDGPGFALPLLKHPTDPVRMLVQEIDEHSNALVGFKTLDGDVDAALEIHSPCRGATNLHLCHCGWRAACGQS